MVQGSGRSRPKVFVVAAVVVALVFAWGLSTLGGGGRERVQPSATDSSRASSPPPWASRQAPPATSQAPSATPQAPSATPQASGRDDGDIAPEDERAESSATNSSRESSSLPPSTPQAPAPGKKDGNVIPEGFPTAATTGVPADIRLQPRTGDITVRRDGAVLEAVDLEGCIVVQANGVLIRNSRIRCAGNGAMLYPIKVVDGYVGTRIESTEIDGLGAARVSLLGNNWVATRVDAHGSFDGPRLGTNTTLQDSYVHDLARKPGTHNDAVQILGGVNVRVVRNTLLAYNQRTDDPMNGAIQTGRLHSELNGMLVEGNYMDGGTYTVRGGAGPRDGQLIRDYVFRNNVFGRNCVYGPAQGVGPPVTWEPNNRWSDTGEVIGTDMQSNKLRCMQTGG